jgi:hypothetical protein
MLGCILHGTWQIARDVFNIYGHFIFRYIRTYLRISFDSSSLLYSFVFRFVSTVRRKAPSQTCRSILTAINVDVTAVSAASVKFHINIQGPV